MKVKRTLENKMPQRGRKLRGGQDYCRSELGKTDTSVAEKVCDDPACEKCYVVKRGRNGYFVDVHELATTREAWMIAKTSPVFKYHVNEYVTDKFIGYAAPTKLEKSLGQKGEKMYSLTSKYIENYGDFEKVFSENYITREALAHFLIQTVLTMDYLWVKGAFLHMDIKPANVLAAKWPTDAIGRFIPEILTVPSKTDVKFLLPGVPEWAVLIDFGNSIYYEDPKRNPDKSGSNIYDDPPWNGDCYLPAFDIFRLLRELERKRRRMSPQAEELFNDVIASTFISPKFIQNFTENETTYDKRYGMLTGRGCEDMRHRMKNKDNRLYLQHHADLILNCAELMSMYELKSVRGSPRRTSGKAGRRASSRRASGAGSPRRASSRRSSSRRPSGARA